MYVDDINNFKSFVRKNPNLIAYVRDGSMSWQKFYDYMIYMGKIIVYGIVILIRR